MFGLNALSLKGWLTLGAAAGVLALAGFAAFEHGRADREAGQLKLWVRCDQLAGSVVVGAPAPAELDKACTATLALAIRHAGQAHACDDGLKAVPEDTAEANAACSTPVKTVIAERDAAQTETNNLRDQLAAAASDRAAAVARATARADLTLKDLQHAQSVLDAAPRGADGLATCDAECLRRLSQAPAGPR